MFRARLLKKTFHYLWRDVSDFTINMVLPILFWLGVVFIGIIVCVPVSYGVSMLLGIGVKSELNLIIIVVCGFLYYLLCLWIYNAYELAQKEIYNENRELVDNIKEPK